MVWSDQSQFPFIVVDNNGNVIFIIDQDGAHVVPQTNTSGEIQLTSDNVTGQADIRFWNFSHTKYAKLAAKDLNGPTNMPTLQMGDFDSTLQLFTGGTAAYGPDFAVMFFADLAGALQSEVVINTNGILINTPVAGTGMLFNTTDGFARLNTGDGVYQTIALGAGWVQGSDLFQIIKDASGRCYLRGAPNGTAGTIVNGTTIASLPATLTPAKTVTMPLGADVIQGANRTPLLRVTTAGLIQIFNVGTGFIYTDGLNYSCLV